MHGVPADATSDDEVVVDLGELETERLSSQTFFSANGKDPSACVSSVEAFL